MRAARLRAQALRAHHTGERRAEARKGHPMEEFAHGPVEILLLGFDGDRPGEALREALLELIDEKTIALLDLVFVARSEAGDPRIIEIEDLPERTQLPGLEDIEELAGQLPPGSSAAVLVVELTWARHFASVLAASGGAVLHQERIPAPVVNAVLAVAG
jgi:hypothetical protein